MSREDGGAVSSVLIEISTINTIELRINRTLNIEERVAFLKLIAEINLGYEKWMQAASSEEVLSDNLRILSRDFMSPYYTSIHNGVVQEFISSNLVIEKISVYSKILNQFLKLVEKFNLLSKENKNTPVVADSHSSDDDTTFTYSGATTQYYCPPHFFCHAVSLVQDDNGVAVYKKEQATSSA